MKARGRFIALGVVVLLAVLAVAAVGAPKTPGPNGGEVVLRVGSQKGGTKSLMLAAGVLEGAPYRIQWAEFPAAQNLLEALGAGAVDLGQVGDAPFLFAYASGSKIKAVQLLQAEGAGA